MTGDRPRAATVLQGDRRKAWRPLPPDARRAALERALAAWAEGDFFETHELLEPAWMGTDDLEERALHQGLIKLAAGYVHAARGNPAGMTKNLAGARRHLAAAGAAAGSCGVDADALVSAIDAKLRSLAAGDLAAALVPPPIRRTARA